MSRTNEEDATNADEEMPIVLKESKEELADVLVPKQEEVVKLPEDVRGDSKMAVVDNVDNSELDENDTVLLKGAMLADGVVIEDIPQQCIDEQGLEERTPGEGQEKGDEVVAKNEVAIK